LYKQFIRVLKNIPTAIEWYTKAANQGNSSAQYSLGYIYKTEDEVKDLQKAINWFQKAADNDYGHAKEEAIKLNKQGYYAKEDEQEGILINAILFFDLFKEIRRITNIQYQSNLSNLSTIPNTPLMSYSMP
jgi:TPR repeat protein